VGPAFRFSASQLDDMVGVLRRRVELLRALLPFDDPNFGLDEGWARFHPYALDLRPGEAALLSLRIMNHSPTEQVFTVRPRLPQGWAPRPAPPLTVRLAAREADAVEVSFAVPANASPGIYVVTADVAWGDWDLREWTEAMVTVKSGRVNAEGRN
jgi:hypothetical protein